jgi:hypothetical protein
MLMLGKCASPACTVPFRKLGSGKLFAFESASIGRSMGSRANCAMSRSPVFFWLCEYCSLSFTLRLDSAGQLTLLRVPDGVRVTIFDSCRLEGGR